MSPTPRPGSPLGGGVLSGKFSRGAAPEVSRVAPASVGERDHRVAAAVAEVADELGVTSSQVALAWTMTRSRAVHPIVGVRRLDQLLENLGALDVTLAPEQAARLEAATGFEVGFPHDFVRDMGPFVFGDVDDRVDG